MYLFYAACTIVSVYTLLLMFCFVLFANNPHLIQSVLNWRLETPCYLVIISLQFRSHYVYIYTHTSIHVPIRKCTIHMNYKMLQINLFAQQIYIRVFVPTYISVLRIWKQTHLFWSQKFLSKMSHFVQNDLNSERLSKHTLPLLVPTLGATIFHYFWF